MKILVTGGFGNIGALVVEEGIRRGHEMAVFEVKNERTSKLARRYARKGVPAVLGDIRDPGDVGRALEGVDAVIHMAAILPPVSEANPALCEAVNVGGTRNLVGAMKAACPSPHLVMVSSASVMGPTQDGVPPIAPASPLNPTDAYSRSKAAAEGIVGESGLSHCILRLAAVLPTVIVPGTMLKMMKVMFDMPLDARCECVMDADVAFALVAAAENLAGSGEIAFMKGFIAGGVEKGFQLRIRGMLEGLFDPIGLELPDEKLFSPDLNSYYLDWYDTAAMQAILGYQNHSFSEYRDSSARSNALIRAVAIAFRPLAMFWLGKQSPRYRGSRWLIPLRSFRW